MRSYLGPGGRSGTRRFSSRSWDHEWTPKVTPGRTPGSGSPLGGTPVLRYEVLRVRSPGPPPSPGKRKASDKENLPYFRIWKSLTYSNRLRPALRRLYKGNLNPKARDRHFKTLRLELGS
ncbi:hypothetical protein F2Q69_00006018 [Brassica cretica]|uniref:Uncharacterized protein n=1 Tax=Brassica cretica TaxID=69181 RepID=A0A8S9P1N8_BRACR|nr:hypothetical protein F2Q69_00006018 [Brassica cretica]